jgi:hypothetical protein
VPPSLRKPIVATLKRLKDRDHVEDDEPFDAVRMVQYSAESGVGASVMPYDAEALEAIVGHKLYAIARLLTL